MQGNTRVRRKTPTLRKQLMEVVGLGGGGGCWPRNDISNSLLKIK